MTQELTLADADELEIEGYYDEKMAQDWAEPTEKLTVGRWTKYGHDRLYINGGISKCSKYSLYVDLQTHEIVSDNDVKHSGGDVEIDGDTATITIEESGEHEHVITVSLEGEAFETEPVVEGPELGPEPADEQTEAEEWDDRGEVTVLRDGRGRFVSWKDVETEDEGDEEFSTPTCGCGCEQAWQDDEWVCPRCDGVRSGPTPRTMPRSTSETRVGQSGGLRR